MDGNILLKERQKIISGLTEARLEAGMTQQRLAHMLGTRRSNISRMESGLQNITIDTLVKTADALGKDVTVLFSDRQLK